MHTRRSRAEPLIELTNNELAELERTNNRSRRSNASTSGMNHDNNNNGVPPGGNAAVPPEIIAQYEERMQQQNNVLLLLQQQMQHMIERQNRPRVRTIGEAVQDLLRMPGARKEVHMVGEPETGYYQEPEDAYIQNSEEVSYVSGQGYGQNRGFNPHYRDYPNLSYRGTNAANPQDQIYPTAPPNQQQPPQQYAPNPSYQPQQNGGYQSQQGQGFQNNYAPQYQPRPYNNQGQSSQQSYAPRAPQQMQNAPAPAQQSRTTLEDVKALFFDGQMKITKAMQEVKGEIMNTTTALTSKLDALATRVKMAETQLAQSAEHMYAVATTTVQGERVDCDNTQGVGAEHELEKLGDPGPLNLQVEIKGKAFEDCLCDLGASVNLMSHSAARSVGLSDFEPTNKSLRFADSSEKKPLGVVVDVPEEVDKVLVPTDFAVLDLRTRSAGQPMDPGDEGSSHVIKFVEAFRPGPAVGEDEWLRRKPGKGEASMHDEAVPPMDPGDEGSSHVINFVEAFRPGPAVGEDEWLRRKPGKGEVSVLYKAAQLEPMIPSKRRMRSAPTFGERSVTRPPDPSSF